MTLNVYEHCKNLCFHGDSPWKKYYTGKIISASTEGGDFPIHVERFPITYHHSHTSFTYIR